VHNTIINVVAKRIAQRAKSKVSHTAFLRQQRIQELKYQKTLIKVLRNQERRVLGLLGVLKSISLKIDDPIAGLTGMWGVETELLIDSSIPHLESSIISGSILAAAQVKGVPMLKGEVADALFVRQNRLKKVSLRLYNQIKMEISEGLALGESTATIADRVNVYYKGTDAQAMRIARTETSSAMSSASLQTYKKNGIEYKRWHTAGDRRVRDTHLMNEGAGVIPVDVAFPGTNEQHPGESEINCRCSVAAVVI